MKPYVVETIYGNDVFTNEYDTYSQAYKSFAKSINDVNRDFDELRIFNTTNGELLLSNKDHYTLRNYLQFDRDEWANKPNFHHPQSDKPSIYFDMDGTLAWWHKDTKGMVYPDQVLDPKYHYFRNLEPHEFMIELAKQLTEKGYDVCINGSADNFTIRDKWEWCDEHCPFIPKDNLFFCPLGADKNEYIRGNAEFSILIDDFNGNLNAWRGTSIKAINSINTADDNIYCIEGYLAETDNSKWNDTMDRAVSHIAQVMERNALAMNRLNLYYEDLQYSVDTNAKDDIKELRTTIRNDNVLADFPLATRKLLSECYKCEQAITEQEQRKEQNKAPQNKHKNNYIKE